MARPDERSGPSPVGALVASVREEVRDPHRRQETTSIVVRVEPRCRAVQVPVTHPVAADRL